MAHETTDLIWPYRAGNIALAETCIETIGKVMDGLAARGGELQNQVPLPGSIRHGSMPLRGQPLGVHAEELELAVRAQILLEGLGVADVPGVLRMLALHHQDRRARGLRQE